LFRTGLEGCPLITVREYAVAVAAAVDTLPEGYSQDDLQQVYMNEAGHHYQIQRLEHHADSFGKHSWTYADDEGFEPILAYELAEKFADRVVELDYPPSREAVAKIYEETVDAPFAVEGLAMGRFNGGMRRAWRYKDLPPITDHSHAVAFAEGLKKLGPSPSAKAVAKVYAETVDAAFVYKFLELGHGGGGKATKREWKCLGFGELDTITSRAEAVAFSAALQALDQKEPDHGFLLAEVGSLVEPYFNPKFTGVVKSGKNSWKAQFGSKYLGVHATSVAAAKAYDRHILETASDYQGRRLKTHLAKLHFPEVLLLSCKRARTA